MTAVPFPPAAGSRTLPAMDPESPEGEPFRALVESIGAVTYVMSAEGEDGPLLYVSPQCKRILGLARDELLATPRLMTEVVHEADRAAVEAASEEARRTGYFELEYRIAHPSGVRWVQTTEHRTKGPDGKTMWFGVTTDVTRRRIAEDERWSAERRYRILVEQLPAVVYVDSPGPEPEVIYMSPNAERILGRSLDEHLADQDLWHRTLHPDDRGVVLERWRQIVKQEEAYEVDYRVIKPDGSIVWIRDTALPVRADDGALLCWQGVLLDITKQKEAEQELQASEARHRALVEGVPAIVYEMDLDDERRTTYVSQHVELVLGYSREEWLDQPDIWVELLHPDDREVELDAHDRLSESGEPWQREYRLVAADGRVVWVHDQASLLRAVDGSPLMWQGVMVDITAQKEAEEHLRLTNDDLERRVRERTSEFEEANELMGLEIGERRRAERELRHAKDEFRHLVEDLPAVVYRWQVRPSDDGTDHSYMSPQIAAMLGYTKDEWHLWGLWRERLHPHDRDRVTRIALESERTGAPYAALARYLHKDGRVVWILDRATLLRRNDAGEPLVFQGVMVDVTDDKEAGTQAAEAERRFRLLGERGPAITFAYELDHSTDIPGVIESYVGPRVTTVLGLEPGELTGAPLPWFSMMHPDDVDPVFTRIQAAWRTGEPWSADYRMLAADGHIVWFHEEGLATTRDERGRPCRFQGVLLDVTERAEGERDLQRREKVLRDLVEGMPAIPWTLHVDHGTGKSWYVFIGPQSQELLGYSPEELSGEIDHFSRLIHPDDLERARAADAVSELTGVWDETYRLVARDGTIRSLRSVGRRVSGPDDPVAVWHGVATDVTDSISSIDEATSLPRTNEEPAQPAG
jgi:PAS domain S-box-containing protein